MRNNAEISTSIIKTRSAKEKEKKTFGNLERKMPVRICRNKGLRRRKEMERKEDKEKRNVDGRKVKGKEEEKSIEGGMEEEMTGIESNLICNVLGVQLKRNEWRKIGEKKNNSEKEIGLINEENNGKDKMIRDKERVCEKWENKNKCEKGVGVKRGK